MYLEQQVCKGGRWRCYQCATAQPDRRFTMGVAGQRRLTVAESHDPFTRVRTATVVSARLSDRISVFRRSAWRVYRTVRATALAFGCANSSRFRACNYLLFPRLSLARLFVTSFTALRSGRFYPPRGEDDDVRQRSHGFVTIIAYRLHKATISLHACTFVRSV